MWSCSWPEFLTSGLARELVLPLGVDRVCGSLLLIYEKFWTKCRHFFWYAVLIQGQRMELQFIYFISSTCSWASVISLVTRLWVRCPSNYCSIPVRIDRFFSSPKYPYWLWDPPSPLFNWYRGIFLWGWKEPGWWRWPLTLSSAELNSWVELCLPSPLCLHYTQGQLHL